MPAVRPLNFAANSLLQTLNALGTSMSEGQLAKILEGSKRSAALEINKCLRHHGLEPDERGRYIIDMLRAEPSGDRIVLDYARQDRTKINKAAEAFEWIAKTMSVNGRRPISSVIDKAESKVIIEKAKQSIQQVARQEPVLRLTLSVTYSQPSVHENGEGQFDSINMMLKGLEFECFSDQHIDYAYFRDHCSLSELHETISQLLQELYQSPFAHFAIGLHISRAGDKSFSYRSVDQSRLLSSLYFDRYDGSRLENNSYPLVLVSAETESMLRHRFSLEAVGEEPLANNPRPVIYRVWADIMAGVAIEKLIPQSLAIPSQQTGRSQTYEVSRTQDLQVASRSLALDLAKHGDAQVMYLDCSPDRKHDLLRPFDEALSTLMGLQRRSTFLRDGKAKPRVIHIKRHIDAFVSHFLRKNADPAISNSIRSLIVGGSDGSDFECLTENLTSLVQGLSEHASLHIVVDNYDEADELLRLLVHMLDTVPPPYCRLKLHLVSGSDMNGPWEGQDPDEGAQRLLQIAAVLGSDLRLTWLQELWLQLDERFSICDRQVLLEEFNRALTACLRHGTLQYCDALVGGSQDEEFLVRLKWVWRSQLAHHRRSLSPSFCQNVARAFWAWLDAERHSKKLRPGDLRMKCRTFEILDQLADNPILSPFMFELGCLLTYRATIVKASQEASRRFERTLHWFGQLDRRGAQDYDAMQKLAISCLWVQEDEELESGSMPGRFLISELERQSHHESQLGTDELFKVPRALWALEFRRGHIASALTYANKTVAIANMPSRKTDLLVMESNHALAVTSFAMGDFSNCLLAAQQGIVCCEHTRSSRLEPGEIHGTHDGRVCCKMYKGLAMQALGQPGAFEWIELGLAFSQRKDANTRVVGKSYARLFYLMGGQLELAVQERLSTCDEGASRAWRQFFNLIKYCLEIANHLDDGTQLCETTQKMNLELRHLRAMDFSSLWSVFLALAEWRLGKTEQAADSLSRAISQAVSRQELAYLSFYRKVEAVVRGDKPMQHWTDLLV